MNLSDWSNIAEIVQAIVIVMTAVITIVRVVRIQYMKWYNRPLKPLSATSWRWKSCNWILHNSPRIRKWVMHDRSRRDKIHNSQNRPRF
jgi:hypothetical protein